MSYSCFISVQIALQLLYCDKMCQYVILENQYIIQYWRINREIYWMCKRKVGVRGTCGKFHYESPPMILGREKGAEEKEKNNMGIIPSIKNAFLLKAKPDFERATVDSLTDGVNRPTSFFGSNNMVMGVAKFHLKIQYKHKKYIKKLLQLSNTLHFPM